jgi:hypothetical protein
VRILGGGRPPIGGSDQEECSHPAAAGVGRSERRREGPVRFEASPTMLIIALLEHTSGLKAGREMPIVLPICPDRCAQGGHFSSSLQTWESGTDLTG